jgi:hypothetical protein
LSLHLVVRSCGHIELKQATEGQFNSPEAVIIKLFAAALIFLPLGMKEGEDEDVDDDDDIFLFSNSRSEKNPFK